MRWRRRWRRRSFGPRRRRCSLGERRYILWRRQNHRKAIHLSEFPLLIIKEEKERTANEPGALRAAVHPAPRYKPIPSSEMILNRPRPRKASGLVWRLILRTSRGRRTISPIPTILLQSAPINQSIDKGQGEPSSGSVHNSFSSSLAKGCIKCRTVILC